MTLEEVYKGKTTKIAVNRDRICKTCNGRGGKDGANSTCSYCKGRGMVTKMVQLGPGMYSQSTGPCSECNGSGESIDEANKCKDCNGKKVVKEKKVLECQVDKGAPHGEKYLFHGESDEYPDREPGDVIIVVDEQPHSVFKRKGADLFMEKEITLLESLSGVNFAVEFLDGTKFVVKNKPGEVIKPDQIMTIPEKGLPFFKNPYKFGNLFILFSVKFPDTLNQSQISEVQQLLKAMKPKGDATMDDGEEVVTMTPFSEDQRNLHAGGGTKGRDSEEEEEDPRMRGG